MSLNEYQQQSLTVTLRLLERALDDIEALLSADRHGLLYAVRSEIDAERESDLRRLSGEVRSVLSDLVQRYQLPTHEQDGLRIISAMLSSTWENLEDSRPEKLRRYGDVNAELARELDPQVESLIHLVLAMERLARG